MLTKRILRRTLNRCWRNWWLTESLPSLALTAPAFIQPTAFSRSTWWSAKSQAAVEQALEALVAAEAKLSPEERKKQDTDFAGTKHADLLLRSAFYKSRTIKADRGYGLFYAVKVLPGKGHEWRALWDEYTKPIFEKLYAEGTVTGYGIDVEQVHPADPGMRFEWHIVPNA